MQLNNNQTCILISSVFIQIKKMIISNLLRSKTVKELLCSQTIIQQIFQINRTINSNLSQTPQHKSHSINSLKQQIQNKKKVMLHRLIKNIQVRLFIQTKKTPNPDFLQFLPQSQIVMGANDSVDIPDQQTAIKTSNLARKLFKINGIKRVFYGPNYISVGKTQNTNWNQIKPLIFQAVQTHYQSGEPIIRDLKANDEGFQQGDSEVVKLIKQILYSRVRPTVQDDGGDIKYVSFDQSTGILKISMLGSCSGCPSSTATLKNGIYKMMRHYVGEVKQVIADNVKQQGSK